MTDRIIISSSPHMHSGNQVRRMMHTVMLALLPALLTGIWFFGIRVILLTGVAVAACIACEYLIQRFILKQQPTINDGSAIITGLIFSMNLPSSLPIWIVIIGAIVSIGIGKMSFGGLGKNIFNPALVGRVFLLIAFPSQMTTWPAPVQNFMEFDATTSATLLNIMKYNPNVEIDTISLLIGNHGGSIGETGAIAILIGLLLLLFKKIITWHTPVAVIVSAFATAAIIHVIDPTHTIPPHYQLLSGGLLFAAVFMATDYATSPLTRTGMLIYGCGIGVITMLIRSFGVYPEGVSFAILIMNGLTPLINHYVQPKPFGGEVKR